MDKADQIINEERDKSRAKLDNARTLLQPFGLVVLVLLFGSGIWLALDMFSSVNNEGRVAFLVSFVLGILAIYGLLSFLPKTRYISAVVRVGGTFVLGSLLFYVLKQYGGI
jgi:FtsH-binding integral membrane protein